jgi:hypothetical protein
LAGAGACVLADEVESTHTSGDRPCGLLERNQAGESERAVFACTGTGGYLVRVAVDKQGTTVSVGATAEAAAKEPAAGQRFRTFSRVQDTIEWRGLKGKPPFGMIQRWWLTDPTGGPPKMTGLVVVTRLPPGPVCHVAYIDLRVNFLKADELARRAADDLARSFKCGSDKVHIVGARGRAIELAQP